MYTATIDSDQIRGATFVRHVEIHDSIGSTNDRAAELARENNIELPALVVARRQTAGRGRGKNVWWSGDGALTFSLLLEPAALGINTADWPRLSLTTAVAVCDALQGELDQVGWAPPTNESVRSQVVGDAHPTLGIKWPNDIMLGGRKLGGILIESPGGAAPAKDRLIIGIGINVNNSLKSATAGPALAGTALCDFTAEEHSLQSILIAVVREAHKRLEQLAASDVRLPAAWQRLCLLVNQRVTVLHDGDRSTEGLCVGIDSEGALLLQTADGPERLYRGSLRPTEQAAED